MPERKGKVLFYLDFKSSSKIYLESESKAKNEGEIEWVIEVWIRDLLKFH